MGKRFYLQWHITNKCGNRCAHCYQRNYDGPQTDPVTARAVLQDLDKTCAAMKAQPYLAITGGDPFMNPDFWEILRLAREHCEHVGVLGNPEGLTDECIPRLKAAGIKHYQVSLDGLEPTHDRIRYPGSHRATMDAIRRLAGYGVAATVMSTVSSENFHEMANVMESVYGAGASRWSFARYSPAERGDCGIPPSEYMRFLVDITRAHQRYDALGHEPIEKDPLLAQLNPTKCDPSAQRVCGGCGIGSSVMTLLPDNTLMACRRHPGSALGVWTPERGLLHHFVHSPKLREFREIHKLEACADCRFLYYCRGCRAAAYCATGDHFGRDPQCPIAAPSMSVVPVKEK